MKKILLVLSATIVSLSSFATFKVENGMRQDTVDTLQTDRRTPTYGVESNALNKYQVTMNRSRTKGKMNKMGEHLNRLRHGGKNTTMQGSTSDGLLMKDGKMIMTKNGKTMPMDAEIRLDNGTSVKTDGTCVDKNGSTMRLKNGESINMAGKMIPWKKIKM